MAGNTEKTTKAAAAASAPFRAADHLRTEAEIAAYIESVLIDGDAGPVPVALRTVADAVAALKSPAWRGDSLRETEQRSGTGQEQPVDWAAATRDLRDPPKASTVHGGIDPPAPSARPPKPRNGRAPGHLRGGCP